MYPQTQAGHVLRVPVCDVGTQLSSFSRHWAFPMPLENQNQCLVAEQGQRDGAAHTWLMVPADVHVEDANVAALLTFVQVQVPG